MIVTPIYLTYQIRSNTTTNFIARIHSLSMHQPYFRNKWSYDHLILTQNVQGSLILDSTIVILSIHGDAMHMISLLVLEGPK
jgi:hypothetical protein